MKTLHSKKPFKPNVAKAQRALEKTREHLRRHGSPLDNLTIEQIVARVRKTREQLWKEKLASRS